MSAPKRHHFVPRAFLERFGETEQVAVRWRHPERDVITNVRNVAVETAFYEFRGPDGEKRLDFERALSEIEGAMMSALRRVDTEKRPPPDGSDERDALLAAVALQLTRTPESRERVLFPIGVANFAGDQPLTVEVVRKYLREKHLGDEPSDDEAQTAFEFVTVALRDRHALTSEFVLGLTLRSAENIIEVLRDREWRLELSRKPRLITSDSPAVAWRPPTPRDDFEGLGVATAVEIRMPLDPSKQLVFTRNTGPATQHMAAKRVRECNNDMAMACHRFVVAHPSQRADIASLPMAARRPALRFQSGPLIRIGTDGRTFEDGEVMHMWVPRR